MTFFPNPTTFVQIGPLTIQWYAVLILTGAFVAYFFINRNLIKMGYESDDADNLFAGCLLVGVLGARIWYVLFSDLSYYLADPIRIIKIWEGGLAIQGGLFAGALFGYWYTRYRKMNFFRLWDAILPYVLIAQAFGRWGNFINKEAFGRTVSEAYFEHWPSFLNFIKEGMYIGGAYHEPMFFYESVLCLIGFGLIMLYKKFNEPRRGDLGFCYLLWYGAIRFWIESSRTDSLMFMGLKMAQIISVIFMIIGALGLLGVFKKWIQSGKPVLLFDLDGTLLDTEPLIHASFKHVFAQMKPDYTLSEEELMGFMGPTLEQCFSGYFSGDDISKACKMYREYNVAHHKDYVKPLPDVKPCLEQWKQEGYTMGIVSSKTHDVVELGLQCCEMSEYFDVIMGVEDYPKSKPDKCGIIEACAKLKVSHDNCIYVGDSAGDIACAKAAGVYAVGFVPNRKREAEMEPTKPNRIIYDFKDMQAIVKQDISFTYDQR